jgi:excisionase family DNA binding protein
MASRQPNYRLVKIHRNYMVEEVAKLLTVHRNTVREWIKRGLPTIDSRRPLLIRGRELSGFLLARRMKGKQPCRPGEIYCVRCRVPRAPAGDMAEYRPLAGNYGNLIGICPCCETMIYRRVNVSRLSEVRGILDVTMREAPARLVESTHPSLNSDFKQERAHHA